MAWNEPGNGNKDPWGNKEDKGPPDIDEVVRNMQRKIGGILAADLQAVTHPIRDLLALV